MSWLIEIKPTAEKQYLRLDKTTRQRIKRVLRDLETCENPLLHPRARALTGKLKGDYRVRIDGWRILMTPNRDDHVLHVFAIIPRGDAY